MICSRSRTTFKLKMLRDANTTYKAAWFYAASTAVYISILILALFFTDAYLFAGHSAYMSVFLVLICAEVLKYMYIQLVFKKDYIYNPKQGFKLLSLVFSIVKELKMMELFRNILMLAGFTCFVFVITVLFGAELLSRHEETLMFSYLITILTMFPVSLNQGAASVMLFLHGNQGKDAFTQVLLRNVQFVVLGAWLGAFVIPLDWSRKWQAWPIPCSFGSLVGFNVAQMVSLVEMFVNYGGTISKLRAKFR